MPPPAGVADPEDFLRALFADAVAAVQADRRIARFLPSPPRGRTIALGAGKAAGSMANALDRHWPGIELLIRDFAYRPSTGAAQPDLKK